MTTNESFAEHHISPVESIDEYYDRYNTEFCLIGLHDFQADHGASP